jgi:predicted ester cyclase
LTIHKLVSDFYSRVWNTGDRSALDDLLSDSFTFQGSLGPEVAGREAFWQIVSSVRAALSDYHCEILECVSDDTRAFAKMKFSGQHTGPFRGHAPTGLMAAWHGAALFHFDGNRIGKIWVLSDTAALDAMLAANAEAARGGL